MKTYGSPGASAAFLARRRRRLRAGTGVVVLAGTIAAVATGRPTAAIGLLVAGFLVRYRLAGTDHAADVGAAAEAEVAARLRSFRPDVLLFDVDLRDRRSPPSSRTSETSAPRSTPNIHATQDVSC